MLEKLNILDNLTAAAFSITIILVFVSHLAGKSQNGYRIGYIQFSLLVQQ